MLPAVVDLKVTQGDTFSQTFWVYENAVPVDLTGSTVKAEYRSKAGAKVAFAVTFEPVAGKITLKYAGAPATYPVYAPYRYDVQQTDPAANIRTLIAGRFDVVRDVTDALA